MHTLLNKASLKSVSEEFISRNLLVYLLKKTQQSFASCLFLRNFPYVRYRMAGIVQPGFICIIDKDVFMKSFPGGWREVSGKRSNVDDEFTVLVQDKDFDGRDTYFEVSMPLQR